MSELAENNLPSDPGALYVRLEDYEEREAELQGRIGRWAEVAMELRERFESAVEALDKAVEEAKGI